MDKDGHRAAIHNLEPIRTMVAPSNVSGLRRVLDLMVQHMDAILSWATDAKPLHILTCKGEAWSWTRERDRCFGCLRAACLKNSILAAPNYTEPFCVGCDTSDDGKGVQVYQLRDPSASDVISNRATIAYYSKCWSPAMAQ